MGKQTCKFTYADRCVIDEHKGMPFSYQLFSCLSEFSLLTCIFVPSLQPLVNQTWKDWPCALSSSPFTGLADCSLLPPHPSPQPPPSVSSCFFQAASAALSTWALFFLTYSLPWASVAVQSSGLSFPSLTASTCLLIPLWACFCLETLMSLRVTPRPSSLIPVLSVGGVLPSCGKVSIHSYGSGHRFQFLTVGLPVF